MSWLSRFLGRKAASSKEKELADSIEEHLRICRQQTMHLVHQEWGIPAVFVDYITSEADAEADRDLPLVYVWKRDTGPDDLSFSVNLGKVRHAMNLFMTSDDLLWDEVLNTIARDLIHLNSEVTIKMMQSTGLTAREIVTAARQEFDLSRRNDVHS